MVGLLGLLAAVVDAGAQGPTPTRSEPIRGQVVDAGNGVPLRRARVIVTAGDRPFSTVFTDDEGRFTIANLPVAPLSAGAGKAGYAAGLVTLSSTNPETDFRFALTRSAAAMGRVLDSMGAPATDAFVRARAISFPNQTQADALTQFFTRTDALGEYRLGNLPAGRYEITAVRVRPEARRSNASLHEQVFGPSESLDTGRIVTMTLAAGDETRGVDFTIAGTMESCPAGPSVRPSPDAVTGRITGRILGPTGEPVPCASVRIVGPDVGIPQVFANRQGAYVLDGLPPGAFILEARRRGYVTTQYGQRDPSSAGAPVRLREGQRRTDVDITLPRFSIVSGTVVDEYGEPMEGVSVWAFRPLQREARPSFASTALPTGTDDRGQYRLMGLEPGTYFIAAMSRDIVSSNGTAETRGYVPTFAPGTLDASVARRVVVTAGLDRDGVDIALTPAQTVTVSGSVVDETGLPFAGMVTLAASARSGVVSIDTRSVSTDASGEFQVRNVPPGDYVLKASDPEKLAASYGMEYVTVVDREPSPARLVLTKGATLEGRLVVDALASANVAGLGVSVTSADADYTPVLGRQPVMWARQTDGTFRATGLFGPSRLTITEMPACEDCYLRSALVNGVDAADRPYDFGLGGGTYRNVELVVSDAGASVEGRATDESGGALTAFTLVVFPTSRDLWYARSRYVKMRRSSPDGSNRVTGLPPGDYYVVATTAADPLVLTGFVDDPDMLEQLAPRARQVTLNERDRLRLTLPIVGR
jgi:hypothetical protein